MNLIGSHHSGRQGASASGGRTEPLAIASGLVLRYDHHTAVAASDLELPAGGIIAVIGPNGSGKSTLLHALAGLIRPAAGTLSVLGSDPVASRDRISFVLQSTAVPRGTPITVAETVAMGRYPSLGLLGRRRAVDRERVKAAMDRLEITELRGRHLTELSGGQRQRVYVAQGIAQDHELLLLDEPLTGLDLVSARTIDRIIHGERDRGCSVVLTTHDLEEARAADHVVLMSGQVVASGPPAAVLTRRNLGEAYGLGALHAAPDLPEIRDAATAMTSADGVFLDDPAHGGTGRAPWTGDGPPRSEIR